MSDPRIVRFRSTSATTADVTPILVRSGTQTRLIFIPTLVNNDDSQAAAVRGTFVYQRKRQNDAWEDIPAINLNSLRAGEGVRLRLKSDELLAFYESLGALYRYYEEVGIQRGDKRCILVDSQSSAHKVLDALQSTPNASNMLAVIDWVISQDPSLIARYFGSREEALLKLDNMFGVARLESFIGRAESLLESSHEEDWQDFSNRRVGL